MDNPTNDTAQDAREARRAARRTTNNNNNTSISSNRDIRNEINEIVPHRRNDNHDVSYELRNDRQNLAIQHNNERHHNRSSNNLNNNYDRRQSGTMHTDSRRSSNGNSSDNDPELRNAAPRTPLPRAGSSNHLSSTTTATGRPPLPSGPSLVRTLGLTPTYTMETLPSTATNYFRNNVTNNINPTTGLPINTNYSTLIPSSSSSSTSFAVGTGGHPPIATVALSADIVTNTINNTSSQPTLISLPPLRTRAAGAGPYALSSTNIPIYEESIVTGAFRKLPVTSTKTKKTSNAASYLQARIAARISFSEMDENESTPLSVELKKIIQSGCRLAQGLLAGVSLVTVLLPTSLTTNNNYNTQFLTSIGILIPSLRFLTWFISILSWLGAIDQLLTSSVLLGNRLLPPYPITNTASVSLIKSLKYIHGSVLAYSLVMATVLYSMPSENALRIGTAAALKQSSSIIPYKPTIDIITSIETWKNTSAARCAFALFGWICVALSTNNPVETYTAIQEAAETELEMAAVENSTNNNSNNNNGTNATLTNSNNTKGKLSNIVSPLSIGTDQPSSLSSPPLTV